MKIALIVHELLAEGGGERQCVSLARALLRMGHDVDLYTLAYDRDHCFPEVCLELKIINVGRGIFPWLRRPVILRAYLDMFHLARTVTRPYEVWNPHHWPAEWGAIRLKNKLGGVVVWTCNDVPNFHQKFRQTEPRVGILKRMMYRLDYLYDRAQTRKINLTVFLSHWAEREFKAIYPVGTAVIRSGADPDRFQPGGNREKIRNRFGFTKDDFVLLWLGIFMPHRRLEDAIQAIARLVKQGRRVKLLLAGSGEKFPDYFAGLQALAGELGVADSVIFSGKVADDEMRDFYCSCDAFLFTNENQTWGLAVLEAMACARPVLVSQGAAIHEILVNGETALLFPARDPLALAEKIDSLINSPELRAAIAQRGMELVRAEYNWKRFGEKMADVFQSVARKCEMKHTDCLRAETIPGNRFRQVK